MARRVVVTGLGAVSPVGNDVPTMWENMISGVCGIEETDVRSEIENVTHSACLKELDAEEEPVDAVDR